MWQHSKNNVRILRTKMECLLSHQNTDFCLRIPRGKIQRKNYKFSGSLFSQLYSEFYLISFLTFNFILYLTQFKSHKFQLNLRILISISEFSPHSHNPILGLTSKFSLSCLILPFRILTFSSECLVLSEFYFCSQNSNFIHRMQNVSLLPQNSYFTYAHFRILSLFSEFKLLVQNSHTFRSRNRGSHRLKKNSVPETKQLILLESYAHLPTPILTTFYRGLSRAS